MSPSQPTFSNSQVHNNQQMPDSSQTPDSEQMRSYASTHSGTHEKPPPPVPGYPQTNHHSQRSPHHSSSTPSQEYDSASQYSDHSAAMPGRGPAFDSPQPNAESSNPPIPQPPPPSNQGIYARHLTQAQTQAYSPALLRNPSAGNTDRQSPHNGMLATAPTSTIVAPTGNLEKIIAVMGVTGTGKSYFIREVSGISDVKVSSSLHSCTTKVRPYSFPYAGVKITLVDTPGFNDTTKSDIEILADICAWMSSNYRKGKLLSGIIYLHRITDVRVDGTSLKNLKMFQKMCGPDDLQNVLLTTTQWSNVNPALGAEREANLLHEDFWAGLISQGASINRFLGTRESGLELINKLIEKKPRRFHIQDQMVEKRMALVDTDVGKFMNEELISLQKKYEKDLENLERERQSALKEKDDEIAMILAEEQERAREKLEGASVERKLLLDLPKAEMRKREEAWRRRDEESERDGRAVIAVNLKDIEFKGHFICALKPHSTKGLGRLIHDINDTSEFEKDPLNITINYYFNFSSAFGAVVEKVVGFDSEGASGHNQIIYNHSIYVPEARAPIKRGTQTFRIFTKF